MFFPQNMFFISNSNLSTHEIDLNWTIIEICFSSVIPIYAHETELNGAIPALFQYIFLLLKVISLVAHNHSCYKHNRQGCWINLENQNNYTRL